MRWWKGDRENDTSKQHEEYRNASNARRQELDRERIERQTQECQEKKCDNRATNFESKGSRGWCTSHVPDETFDG